MPNEVYNIRNKETGSFVENEAGEVLEYATELEAANMATYFSTSTGVCHEFVGPNPKTPR